MGMRVAFAGLLGSGHSDEVERLAGGKCYAILRRGAGIHGPSIQSFGDVE
jgi:hypothetical protein